MAILASSSNAGCIYIHLRMIYLPWDCSSFPNWNLHLMERFPTSEETQVKKQPPEFQKQFNDWKFCILKLVWPRFSFHGWGDWGLEESSDFCNHSYFTSFLLHQDLVQNHDKINSTLCYMITKFDRVKFTLEG